MWRDINLKKFDMNELMNYKMHSEFSPELNSLETGIFNSFVRGPTRRTFRSKEDTFVQVFLV